MIWEVIARSQSATLFRQLFVGSKNMLYCRIDVYRHLRGLNAGSEVSFLLSCMNIILHNCNWGGIITRKHWCRSILNRINERILYKKSWNEWKSNIFDRKIYERLLLLQVEFNRPRKCFIKYNHLVIKYFDWAVSPKPLHLAQSVSRNSFSSSFIMKMNYHWLLSEEWHWINVSRMNNLMTTWSIMNELPCIQAITPCISRSQLIALISIQYLQED